ncbi:selenocysteine lyase [Paramormyrops kingsleyae]|uniref:selenocysteine lyase n=1 Tax=Paramormyrops kingsleyae TaxID=1676925 RepID=UPI003B9745BE
MGDAVVGIPNKDQQALVEQTVSNCRDQEERIYMDYNATTPLDPEVIMAITEALKDAWGNPSSTYLPGRKAKGINDKSRESVASMVNGQAEDIIFMSGGTEANNLVFYTAVKHFWDSWGATLLNEKQTTVLPHIITSSIEHDSVKITADSLLKEGKADITFVKVSKVTGRVEVNDVLAAVRPNTCLISVMLANNETGVIMRIKELCQRVQLLNVQRSGPRILLHSDGAQAVGKVKVDVQELGVDYLTIVGHKFYGPRIGALYVNKPGSITPLFPMFFGGGQERNFRPGTENTPMIAGLGKAAELVNLHLPEYEAHLCDIKKYLEQRLQTVFGKEKIHFNSHFPGSETLPNTCNVSLLGPGLEGWKVLSSCRWLLASVGAACHSDKVERPSHILLSCGISPKVAANALRLSVGRRTTRKDIDLAVEDLREAVCRLEGGS